MADEDINHKRLQQHGLLAVVSKLCIGPNRLPVRHAEREEPNNVSDSGWILRSGNETPEYADDSGNYALVPLNLMVGTDRSLDILHEQPVGTELTRKDAAEPWRWIIDGKIVDEDGRIIATF